MVSDIINEAKKHFGEISIVRGNKHNLLGTNIEIKDITIQVYMVEQLKERIESFGEGVSMLFTSPAKNKLFEVREYSEQLSQNKGELFHSMVGKILFIMKRSRPDLETAVGFLETRVLKSDVDDREKLRRILRFFHCNLKEKRCLGATSLDEIFTWVDASYLVHHVMKSQNGGVMSMGLGVTHCVLSKKKFITKSSTEAELVGASDYLPHNIWYVMFMHHQGYLKNYNKFFQDNQSPMRMEVNGRNYFTGNLRHINIRYFLIKDQTDKEELSIVYCPTHLMLSDYFTKPLQGSLLHKFRDTIMVRVSTLTIPEDKFSYTIKENVGKQIPPKEITSGTGEPLKETKDMLEDENNKQARTSTGGPLKNKEMLRDGNDKQVRMSPGDTLKKKEMYKD